MALYYNPQEKGRDMNKIIIALLMIVFATTANAADAPTPPPENIWASLLPFVFVFVIFYFLILRPQQKKIKEHQAMVAAVQKGDKVVLSGGMLGKVIKVDNTSNIVEVEIASGVVVKVIPSTIASITSDKPLNDNNKK